MKSASSFPALTLLFGHFFVLQHLLRVTEFSIRRLLFALLNELSKDFVVGSFSLGERRKLLARFHSFDVALLNLRTVDVVCEFLLRSLLNMANRFVNTTIAEFRELSRRELALPVKRSNLHRLTLGHPDTSSALRHFLRVHNSANLLRRLILVFVINLRSLFLRRR